MTQNWLDQFSGVLQSRLPRPTSDHFPILLEGGGLRRGPSPFRFENMWLKVEGFKDLLWSWWQGTVVRSSASFKLAAKLTEVKQKSDLGIGMFLEGWNLTKIQLFNKWSFGIWWKVRGVCQKRKQR